MSYGEQTVRLLPEVILSVAGTLIMVLSPVVKRARTLGYLALGSLALALFSAHFQFHHDNFGPAFSGLVVSDPYGIFFRELFIIVGALAILSSFDYLEREGIESGEYYALILLSVVGQGLMACSVDLVMIFIALEISSISTYILTGYRRHDQRSTEAALKYFLLGSFATAFFLYGIAILYGATGSTNLAAIRAAIPQANGPLVGMAAALLFVGLAFKVSGAPFQIWTPDVYQGAPTPVTAFMSAAPKAAAFAVFLRVFLGGLTPAAGYFWLLWTCAVLSMFIGNLAALVQGNIKRMLAYSSIAHAGYILAAFTARSEMGVAAAMFYLAIYSVTNVGAFLVVAHLSGLGEKHLSMSDYAGLGRRRPVLAACFTVFLLSLLGVPLTGGFFGKFYIVTAAVAAGLPGLAVIVMINSAIGAYYYLRVVVAMYMEGAENPAAAIAAPAASVAVLVFTVVGVFYLGVLPSQVLTWASQAANIFK
jgi:NADH-quinone oxidoreductase subunit N